MSYFIYVLRSSSNELYIGQTNNLQRREVEQSGNTTKTAKFVKDSGKFKLVYFEEYQTRLEAIYVAQADKLFLLKGHPRL